MPDRQRKEDCMASLPRTLHRIGHAAAWPRFQCKLEPKTTCSRFKANIVRTTHVSVSVGKMTTLERKAVRFALSKPTRSVRWRNPEICYVRQRHRTGQPDNRPTNSRRLCSRRRYRSLYIDYNRHPKVTDSLRFNTHPTLCLGPQQHSAIRH